MTRHGWRLTLAADRRGTVWLEYALIAGISAYAIMNGMRPLTEAIAAAITGAL